jgi:hypothetical protein
MGNTTFNEWRAYFELKAEDEAKATKDAQKPTTSNTTTKSFGS